ncbi:MAG: hypothetical protein Q4B57_04670 [Eubacteriales bacterium]|nr:hypothetical protein [Eubacteriales bacterium]
MKEYKKGLHKKQEENQRIIDSYDYLGKAASPTDCTGLIPSAPRSDDEIEAYEDLYPFLPPSKSTPRI